MVSSAAPSWIKQRQTNKSDSGSNGERSNEAHEETDEARKSNKHLEDGAHNNGALQLEPETSQLLGINH